VVPAVYVLIAKDHRKGHATEDASEAAVPVAVSEEPTVEQRLEHQGANGEGEANGQDGTNGQDEASEPSEPGEPNGR
jgi:hypothetical protein